MASAKSAVGQRWATSSSVSPLRLLIACGQSGSNPGTQVSASVCGCLCVFLLFPDRRKDSFHPKHAFLEKAGGPAPGPGERGPALMCHAISGSQGWPAWEKLGGPVPKSALHALFFLPSPSPKHTMKTTATATISSPSLNTRLPLVTRKLPF